MVERSLRVGICALEAACHLAQAFPSLIHTLAFGHLSWDRRRLACTPRRTHHPVLFNFPVFLAHASMRTNAHSPSGNSIAPIKARISNSCVTADNGAPARCSAVELLLPTPNNFRHADSV